MSSTTNNKDKTAADRSEEMTPERKRAILARKKKRARQRRVKKQMIFVLALLAVIVAATVIGVSVWHSAKKDTKEKVQVEQETKEPAMNTKSVKEDEVLHLSFYTLIAVPETAFQQKDKQVSETLAQKHITVKEFESILQQLYEQNYILIRMHDLADGESVQIPLDKKPLIISQQDVNYDLRLREKGFSSRLIVDAGGKIVNERIRMDGSMTTGNFDVIPCIEQFVREHPDFSYNGAKGVIGLTGYQGILGYRTAPFFGQAENNPFVSEFGLFDVEKEKQQVQILIQALKDAGWEFACNGYQGVSYNTSVDQIRQDMALWKEQVEPLVGPVDILLYPQGNDLNMRQPYSSEDERYEYLKECGIHFYCALDRTGSWVNRRNDELRSNYQMIDGYRMHQDLYDHAGYFEGVLDFSHIYDQTRPGGELAKTDEEETEEEQENQETDEE